MFDMNMGINHQVRAVAEFLNRGEGIGWDDERKECRARIDVAPWYNCRERGLVFVVSDGFYKTQSKLVVAVFEHRNTTDIHTVEWETEESFLNPPTLHDVPASHPWTNDKWATSASVRHGEIGVMADHIRERFEAFCKTW